MTDQYIEIAQNPLVSRLLKQLGVTPPPRLNRSLEAWNESLLEGQKILVGGNGGLCRDIQEWLESSGASFILTPEVEPSAFTDLSRCRRGTLDEAQSENGITGVFYDATHCQTISDLSQLYQFFHKVCQFSRPNMRIVIACRDPLDQITAESRAVCHGIEGFTRSLAKEIGRQGSTAQLLNIGSGSEARKRAGAFFQFFMSNHSAFITGQKIRITSQVRGLSQPTLSGSLAGKSALVTGAAQGIGLAIAQSLAAEGVHVFCLDRPESKEALQAVAEEIEGHAIACALGAVDTSSQIVEEIKQQLGYLDIVVHNAGITRDRSLKKMSQSDWQQVLNVNLEAPIHLTSALLEQNLLRDHGSVICLSSISGLAGNFGQCNYSTAKAGLVGYVQGLAKDLSKRGITVNAIAPGFIETPMTAKIPFVMRQVARRMATLGQGGKAQDVADAVCFLASPCSLGMTGGVLRVCGGHLMGA